MRGHIAKKCTRGCKKAGRKCTAGCTRWYPVVEETGADRQRVRRWHPGHDRRRDAETALRELLTRVDSGSYVSPTRQTVGDYLTTEWLPAIKSSVRPGTFDGYERTVRGRIVPGLGHVQLRALGVPHLNAFYGDLLDHGRAGGTGPLSPRSVQLTHVVLHRALRDAVRWGKLSRNVATDAASPKVPRPEMRVWRPDEARQFLTVAAGDRHYPAWLIFLTVGLRRGELSGLTWGDLDLDAATLSVRRARITVNYGDVRISEPKTARGRRTVGLPPGVVAALRELRRTHAEDRLRAGSAWMGPQQQSELPIVCNELGVPPHPEYLSRRFAAIARQAGVPIIRLHDARHTAASLMVEGNVDARTVADTLGHANVAFTLQTYVHGSSDRQRAASDAVADLLLRPGRNPVEEGVR